MKKSLLLILFFCSISLVSFGQKQYADIIYKKGKLYIIENIDDKKAENAVKDASGNDIVFKDILCAFNYLSLNGWELVETSFRLGVAQDLVTFGKDSPMCKFLFFRELSKEELEKKVEEGIIK